MWQVEKKQSTANQKAGKLKSGELQMSLEKRVNKIELDYGIGGAKKHVGVIVMPGQNAELLQKEKLKELGGELEDYQWGFVMVNCPDRKQDEPENSDESGD